MARPLRAEVEGGLYHLIARGNNRQLIFHDDEDFQRLLSLLATQKGKLGFYIDAYCLMSNHIHLLIERQAVPVGRIMLRILTGYSQYYNRKYRKTGHVFQGRHKAILCEADRYLGELVRYIHLNPVRAKMVRKAERYPWSSQRAYLGLEPSTFVDVDPVLRLFGAKKAKARENFAKFVSSGAKQGHMNEFYEAGKAGILGSEEFVDDSIHRIWEKDSSIARRATQVEAGTFRPAAILSAVESVLKIEPDEFLSRSKTARSVLAKEALIAAARIIGANTFELSDLVGLSTSTISRRSDNAMQRRKENSEFRRDVDKIVNLYRASH